MSVAWVAGATGLVGSHLVHELARRASYDRVVALVRGGAEDMPRGVERAVVNFDDPATFPAGPVNDVYCALGTTIGKAGSQEAFRRVDYEYPLRVARHAVEAGARQFLLVSSVGANHRSSNFYLRVKGELELALAALPWSSLRIFRPSVLLGARPESRMGESIGKGLAVAIGFLLVGPLSQYRGMPAETLARAMAQAAREPGPRVLHYREIVEMARR